MGRSTRLQSAIVGTLVGLGCLALLFRQVDLRQSWNALGRLNGAFLIVPLAFSILNLPLRAWRWQAIFPSASRPRFGKCLIVLGIGNMANFLLPGRAGDIARCVLLSNDGGITESSRTLATLAIEKVLDGLALVGLVLLTMWSLHPPHWIIGLLRIAIAIFGGALILLIFLRYNTHFFIEYARKGVRFARLSSLERKVDGLLTAFADGLSATNSASQITILVFLTAGIWATEAGLIWGLAGALGLAVPLKSAVVASAILGLGFMIPAAPGGLGTYELFGTEAFKLAGVAASSALALTLMIHAWIYVANIGIGVCLLAIQGISLAQLRSRIVVDSATASTIRPSL